MGAFFLQICYLQSQQKQKIKDEKGKERKDKKQNFFYFNFAIFCQFRRLLVRNTSSNIFLTSKITFYFVG